MYWNAGECREEWAGISINRNMRCIEIVARRLLARPYDRLIETWDVLKLILCPQFCCQNMINRNMRCIEISVLWRQAAGSGRINRNMRCIEIQVCCLFHHRCSGLIETWDVLKFFRKMKEEVMILINRNMRCIEISQTRLHPLHTAD